MAVIDSHLMSYLLLYDHDLGDNVVPTATAFFLQISDTIQCKSSYSLSTITTYLASSSYPGGLEEPFTSQVLLKELQVLQILSKIVSHATQEGCSL
jgi:hypothetical protein